jgi:glutaminyl-peptide cyclotransferase
MIDPQRAFARIQEQHALGPRFVGSPGHAAAQELLLTWLAGAERVREQTFTETYFGKPVTCRNLWGRYEGERPGRILLGTHYDTRPWADRDPDPARRHDPVPGANDGGSGVALLAELGRELTGRQDRPSVDIVFFDAEDWHEIDGKEVSQGARSFVAQLLAADTPDGVIIVDMVGGRNLVLDVDVNCQDHDPSYRLTLDLFQLGHSLGLPAFGMKKPHPYKWIGCDHTPFMAADVPTALLIDLDYPEWHTVQDLPAACDAESLAQVGAVLETFLFSPTTASRQRLTRSSAPGRSVA